MCTNETDFDLIVIGNAEPVDYHARWLGSCVPAARVPDEAGSKTVFALSLWDYVCEGKKPARTVPPAPSKTWVLPSATIDGGGSSFSSTII